MFEIMLISALFFGLQAALNISFTVKTLTLEDETNRLSQNLGKKLHKTT